METRTLQRFDEVIKNVCQLIKMVDECPGMKYEERLKVNNLTTL